MGWDEARPPPAPDLASPPLSRDPASSCDPQPHTWFWFPPGPPASGPHLQRPLRSTPTSLGPCWDMSVHPRGSQGHRQGLQALSPTSAFTSAWDLSWAPGPCQKMAARASPPGQRRDGVAGQSGKEGRPDPTFWRDSFTLLSPHLPSLISSFFNDKVLKTQSHQLEFLCLFQYFKFLPI